ncbi:MAG: ornithine cyclodeaminase [Rhodobacteraceae bacterium]|nr:ornithine cyclodeaminase [Paracoccaceae bacterium]
MTPDVIRYDDAIGLLSWRKAVDALRAGHLRPKAEIADLILGPQSASLLNRAAHVDGLGYGVKAVTIVGDNPARDLPTVQGAMMVFAPETGALTAIIDSRLVTEIKTASDSLLGAQLLARPDSTRLLIVGAGVVAASLVRAYAAVFPALEQIAVWARRPEQAENLVARAADIAVELVVAEDLATYASAADIVSSATMAREPVLKGEWISAGTHVDLIGAFKSDMREADDALISGGSLYVDSRDTTLDHIGELVIPLAAGVITRADVKGDFYDLVGKGGAARRSAEEVTVFKNGGGAHLDLMIANYIARAVGGTA